MERWCQIHAVEWLPWKGLARVACCSRGVRFATCEGRPVLDLSEGRLAVRRGPLSPAELGALQPVDESSGHEWKDTLLHRLGVYFVSSAVGRVLFKPKVFHLWPSPAGCIAGSLDSHGSQSFMGCIRVPKSCVEDCSKAWVTKRDVVYVQDGYCKQYLWSGVLELTTVADWKREPSGVGLTMHYRHNLDYALSQALHLRHRLVMLKVPRAFLGVSARKAWAISDLHATPPMPERSPAESPFRRYCLDRWREVAVDRLDWIYQDRNVHDFTREALMDSNFPWDGSFGQIHDYLYERRAEEGARGAFACSWEHAGLDVMAFCSDCKAWVDHADLFRSENEEVEEIETETGIAIWVQGCWVVERPDYGHEFEDDESSNSLREYGQDLALFGKRLRGKERRLRRSSKKNGLCWEYNSDLCCWKLHEDDENYFVRWRKTCRAETAVREVGHFPRRAERCDVPNPVDDRGLSS